MKQKQQKPMKDWMKIGVGLISIVFFLAISFGLYKYNALFNQIYEPLPQKDPSTALTPLTNLTNKLEESLKSDGNTNSEEGILEPFILLLLGVDSREQEYARSDTIILAMINPKLNKVTLLSIPRDTRVAIPGRGYEKLNHTMAYGGVPLVKETLENFLNVPIHRYMTVNFEGFRQMIDQLGGIEIEVERRMRYHDPTDGTRINLQPGKQVLSGKEALDYVRHRHDDRGTRYYSSDFDRAQRQQKVIRAIVDQGKEFATVFKIFSLMDIVGDNMKTDLQKRELEMLVSRFKNITSNEIESIQLSGRDRWIREGKSTVYYFDVAEKDRQAIKQSINDALRRSQKSNNEGINEDIDDEMSEDKDVKKS